MYFVVENKIIDYFIVNTFCLYYYTSDDLYILLYWSYDIIYYTIHNILFIY